MSVRSVVSSTSTGSVRYRTVSSSGSIDESLFGSRKRNTHQAKKTKNNHIEQVQHTKSHNKSNCLKQKDICRIKIMAKDPTVKDFSDSLQYSSDKVDEKRKRAIEKRKLMEAIDDERRRKEVLQKQNLQKNESDLNENGSAMGEDFVKLLNTISQRAVAFHIRDKQLHDMEEKVKKEQEYEKRMDLAMEVSRLKEIERREQLECKKSQKRIADRIVIEEQMDERRRLRLLQEEEREQENQRMIEKQKRYEEQARAVEGRKKEESIKARNEILEANRAIFEARVEAKRREKEEVEEILAYQAMQDEKLRLREEAEAEAANQKREIQKRMLESQAKILDKNRELDELRQRRAWEEAERRARRKDLQDAKKRRNDMLEMNAFRRKQEAEKEEQRQKENIAQQQEYEDTIRQAYEMAKREEEESKQREVKNAKFRKDLQKQISENEEKKKKQLFEKQDEGRRIKDEILQERKNLENIRTKMVNDMAKIGVNEKYFSEMLAMDIEKFHMR